MILLMKRVWKSFANVSLSWTRDYPLLRADICMSLLLDLLFSRGLMGSVKVVDARGIREVTDLERTETGGDVMQE
jgi:hypothetical protein